MRHKILFSLLFALIVLIPFQKAQASGSQSVTRGDAMPTIFWSITGSSSDCTFSTSYPDAAGDGIRTEWNALASGASGSKSFTGKNVWANPGSYTFTCTILVGTTLYSDTATLVVNDCLLPATWDAVNHVCAAAGSPVISSFTATPNSLPAGGGSSTLAWTVANVTSCWASGSWTGWKSNTGSSETVTVTTTTTYTLECWNAVGVSSGQSNVLVTVALAPAALNICPAPSTTIDTVSPGYMVVYYTPIGTSFTGCGSPNGSNVTGSAVWTSSNNAVVTVSGGTLSGVSLGSATITANYSGLSDSRSVTVTCTPTNFCSTDSRTETTCIGDTFTIADDGCGNVVSGCPGNRACDFNWKEVAP